MDLLKANSKGTLPLNGAHIISPDEIGPPLGVRVWVRVRARVRVERYFPRGQMS